MNWVISEYAIKTSAERAKTVYRVGYYYTWDGKDNCFYYIEEFEDKKKAMALCSYLNGGQKP